MKRISILTFILLCSTLYSNELEKKVDLWFNNNLSNSDVIDFLDLNLENETLSTYEKSLFYLYKGQVLFLEKNKKESILSLEKAITEIELALSKENKSDYWRVMSEAESYIMLQKGVTYIIKNSKNVDAHAKKALELNPNNIKASIIVSGGLINAPSIFGGDIDKGIDLLLLSTKQESITKEENFNVLISLSTAYENKKDKDKAIEFCFNALKIYPNNIQAREKLRSLQR